MCYDRKTVGENIRNYRRFHGMTQKQVAERAHLSPSFYRKLEQGAAGMSVTTLGSLCHVLRVRPIALFFDDPSLSANPAFCLTEVLSTYPPEVQKAVKELLEAYLQ